MAFDAGYLLTFHSAAVAENELLVGSLEGEERLNRPYSLALELTSSQDGLDLRALLAEKAKVGLLTSRENETRWFHGVLMSIKVKEKRQDHTRYEAVLAPRMANLGLCSRSRVFLAKTVPQIIEEVLKDHGLASDDFEFRVRSQDFSEREYVVQYEETDLDFVHRWMEHEGLFYYFEQLDDREKLIICDSMAGYYDPAGTERTYNYHPHEDEGQQAAQDSADWFRDEVVSKISLEVRAIPQRVILTDHNWRAPDLDLEVEAQASDAGRSFQFEYNNHYKTTQEGRRLATLRAQEHACREVVYRGRSDIKLMAPGARFTLFQHFRPEFNSEHVCIAVTHSARQLVESTASRVISAEYHNRFVSIPAGAQFRPERTTPWPAIHGVMHAWIDATDSAGDYAEVNGDGCYKVVLPFDLSGAGGGNASRWIRMAQPYVGSGMGMHFPLHKGTEVLLSHIDGDPDRPIIVGAVPDATTGNVVNSSNNVESVINTGGGNRMTLHDTSGSERVTFYSPKSNTTFSIGAYPPASSS